VTPGSDAAATPRRSSELEFSVRRCLEDDWVAVRRLHVKLALELPIVVDVALDEALATGDEEWQRFTARCSTDAAQALYVAEAERGCVGVCQISVEGTVAQLSMLYVEGPWRHHGVASALVSAVVGWAEESPARVLVAHIADSSRAVSLARRLGWQRRDEEFVSRHGLVERKWTFDPAAVPE
jgi:GNAT superfamily N-acetyltransferase